MGARRGRAVTVLSLSLCACSFVAAAQDSKPVFRAPGGIRDALYVDGPNLLYLASYETAEVIAIRLETGEPVARIPAGKGTSALSENGDKLAALNRHESSLTLIQLPEHSVIGTVQLEAGASSVFAAGPDRFGVVDPFHQSITFVNAAAAEISRRISIPDAVPVAAVMVAGQIALLTRTPEEIRFLDLTTFDVVYAAPLAQGMKCLLPLSDGSIAVASNERVTILTSGRITNEFDFPAQSLSVSDSRIVGVAFPDAYELTPGTSERATSWRLPNGASNALAFDGGLLAWSSRDGRVWSLSRAEAIPAAARAESPSGVVAEAVSAAPSAEPPTQLEAPIPDVAEASPRADAGGPQVVPAVQRSANDETQVASSPRESAPVEEAEAAQPKPLTRAEKREAKRQRRREQGRKDAESGAARQTALYDIKPERIGISGLSPHAPYFGSPRGTWEQELIDALTVTSESASLLSVDWSQDVENIQSPLGSLRVQGDLIEADQRTTFQVGDARIEADQLSISLESRELELRGDVRIERPGASLAADVLRIVDPPLAPTGELRPLVPVRESRAAAHPLIPHGTSPDDFAPTEARGMLHAENVVWKEKGKRELVADSVELDLRDRSGALVNAQGHVGPLYFAAQDLKVDGPRSVYAQELWVSTCDLPVPHYRLRLKRAELEDDGTFRGSNVRVQVRDVQTPIFAPRVLASVAPGERALATEIDFGRRAELGNMLNVAQWFKATEHSNLAPRIFATTKEGVGFGVDGNYDLMNAPAATFYRSRGEFESLYTTEDRGYAHWYHQQELLWNTRALVQWEQWSDEAFLKDFYNNEYSDRTGPRSFANVTHTNPEYLVTGTFAPSTHSFTTETEKLPELTFHLLERRAAGDLYGTFDGVSGFYRTQQDEVDSMRTVLLGRMSYDLNLAPGFNVLPFVEVDGTYYTHAIEDDNDAVRGSGTVGVTMQARAQRSFGGVRKFSGFKHMIIPSATLLYQPKATLESEEVPRFDDLDDRPARFRLETMLDNVLLGRNVSTGSIWPVARVTFYQGNDFLNERAESSDYELEVEIRPRPWWGFQAIGEIHDVDTGEDEDLGENFDRVLGYVFFDNEQGKNNLNGRLGYAYTDAAGEVLNQEILYGLGYKLSPNWSAAFEHRYDIHRNELTRQSYAIRRRLHDWEMGFFVREREQGIDVGLDINLLDFRDVKFGF